MITRFHTYQKEKYTEFDHHAKQSTIRITIVHYSRVEGSHRTHDMESMEKVQPGGGDCYAHTKLIKICWKLQKANTQPNVVNSLRPPKVKLRPEAYPLSSLFGFRGTCPRTICNYIDHCDKGNVDITRNIRLASSSAPKKIDRKVTLSLRYFAWNCQPMSKIMPYLNPWTSVYLNW